MVHLSSSSSYFKSDNDLQLLLTNLHSSPSIKVRKEVCSVLSIILEKFHRLKDLKRFIKAILPSLQPDRIAKLSLINHEEGCYCEILWLLSQKENLLKVHGTLRNSMIAALLPLYTSSNKEIYCYFKELLCIIAPTKEILLPLLNKQKNDVIKHVIESYPCEFTKNDLPDHYFPTASPRIASSPYKQTTTKFSFDFVDKSNSPPIVKDTKASKQVLFYHIPLINRLVYEMLVNEEFHMILKNYVVFNMLVNIVHILLLRNISLFYSLHLKQVLLVHKPIDCLKNVGK